jgi:sortase A
MKGVRNINNFRKIKSKIPYIIFILIILVGISLISYPAVSAFIADYTSTKVIVDYQAKLKNELRQQLIEQSANEKEIYKKLADVNNNPLSFYETNKKDKVYKKVKEKTEYKNGEMEGYITIPKIDVALAIYEGTNENVLYKGIGHLNNTSLPVGGKGTHCVLTGHSGLSSSTLFSHLEDLEKGDEFYITSNGKTLKYIVDKISTIKPAEADDYIAVDENKDYCTLITCTPVTINTHRLLVRGIRTNYVPDEEKDKDIIQNKAKTQNYILTILALSVFVVVFIIREIYKFYNKKQKRKFSIKTKC